MTTYNGVVTKNGVFAYPAAVDTTFFAGGIALTGGVNAASGPINAQSLWLPNGDGSELGAAIFGDDSMGKIWADYGGNIMHLSGDQSPDWWVDTRLFVSSGFISTPTVADLALAVNSSVKWSVNSSGSFTAAASTQQINWGNFNITQSSSSVWNFKYGTSTTMSYTVTSGQSGYFIAQDPSGGAQSILLCNSNTGYVAMGSQTAHPLWFLTSGGHKWTMDTAGALYPVSTYALGNSSNPVGSLTLAAAGTFAFGSTTAISSGVITDACHGSRSGGTYHSAVTTSVNGFMSSTDKTKLDGIASQATPAIVTFGGNSCGTDTTSRYLAAGGYDDTSPSTVVSYWVVPLAGYVRAFYINLNTAPSGNQIGFAVQKNGSDFDTVYIASGGTAGNHTNIAMSVAAGDRVSVRVFNSGTQTTAAVRPSVSLTFCAS